MMVGAYLTTGPFDIFGKKSDAGIYDKLAKSTLYAEVGIFHIIVNAGVYLAVISAIISAILFIIGSSGKSGKLAEAKGRIVRVFVVSVLFFAVGSIINFLQSMGLDAR